MWQVQLTLGRQPETLPTWAEAVQWVVRTGYVIGNSSLRARWRWMAGHVG